MVIFIVLFIPQKLLQQYKDRWLGENFRLYGSVSLGGGGGGGGGEGGLETLKNA